MEDTNDKYTEALRPYDRPVPASELNKYMKEVNNGINHLKIELAVVKTKIDNHMSNYDDLKKRLERCEENVETLEDKLQTINSTRDKHWITALITFATGLILAGVTFVLSIFFK